ncbi:MAG: phospholipase D-like domain-containing protein [Patescibacteria group bacterium]
MTWIKILRQKTKKGDGRNWLALLIFFGLPLVLLIGGLSLGVKFLPFYQKAKNIILEPAQIIEISEPFSGNLYFNDELGIDNFSSLIIANLDTAKYKIELAMYSMDSATIADALYRAADRGVLINLIFSDKHQAIINKLFKNPHQNITINFRSSDLGYMHHKFLLIDRQTTAPKLFFSSYNFTNIQGKYDPSFILETSRPELVDIFGQEFGRLAAGQHGEAKKATTSNPFAALIKYPEGFLEIWFSPGTAQKNVKRRMLNLIKDSKSNIKVMIWTLTDKEIAAALVAAAQKLPVNIITDDSNWSVDNSVFPILAAQKERQNLNNLEIITDSKNSEGINKLYTGNSLNSFLHHHLMIIDDQTVIFGTNNWSYNGFSKNNESIMISNIASLTSAFEQSYSTNYNKNK